MDKIETIYKEADSLKKLKHKNIIKLLYSIPIRKSNSLVVVMEYARGGEVREYLDGKKCLDENDARILFV